MTRRADAGLILLLLAALTLRLYLASTEAYVHDEANTAIALAETISFTPGALHLPLRGENHGAMPAYIVHASRALFGTTPLATRMLHVLLGLGTVLLIYSLAREWYGPVAARWAAALMAFNEYFLDVSSRVTAHVPHLLFATAAIVAFVRFLRVHHVGHLYAAAALLGAAFYCKEHSALLLPLFFVTLLHAKHRRWLRSVHVYLACGVFVMAIVPDLVWNARSTGQQAQVSYGNQTLSQATYGNHLQRIGGLGLSPYPAMFYGRHLVMPMYQVLTGNAVVDATPEYRSVNPALGVLLLAAVVLTTALPSRRVDATAFLLLVFWSIFMFFTLIKKGDPPGRLDPVSWIWVEVTLIPAVILTGARMAQATGAWRPAIRTAAIALLIYACTPPVLGLAGASAGQAQEGTSQVSHALQVLAADTVIDVRERPLRTIGVAVAISGAVGVLAGFWVGWLLRGRRNRPPS